MNRTQLTDRQWVRAVAVIVGFTVVLTVDFVGVLALASRGAGDLSARLPSYVLAMAIAFVVGIFVFARYGADAKTVMFSATGFGVATFVLFGLAVEGVVYAIAKPETVFASQLVVYFLAAGLIATGLGYWLVTYWRDLVSNPRHRRR